MMPKKIYTLFLAFLVVLLGFTAPAYAQTNLCTSQGTGTTVTYNIFSNCHQVTNNTGVTICVFTGTSGEWSTFTASATPWSGVSVSGCACTGTPCGTLSNGGTCTVYASSAPTGPCTSSTITCTNGSTSGGNGYTATSCTAGCNATSTTWNTSCSGSVAAAAAGGAQTVTNTAGGYTGSETATCNAGGAGTFAYSGASCAASCSCTLPSNIGGGTLACNASTTTSYYYKQRVYVNACCPNITSCSGLQIQANCSAAGVLTCNDMYSDTGCTGTYYTSCTVYTSGGCFVADVSVLMADGSQKLISEIQKGDVVKGETSDNEVLEVKTIETSEDLYGLNGGPAFVTGGHPFRTALGWKAIDPSKTPQEGHAVDTTQLEIGDVLLTDTGSITIHSIERYPAHDVRVYNPTTDGDHTYYANKLLVHNKCVQC